MARGGYRKPSNPAPVSNPGSGRRTDGGPTQGVKQMTGGAYGEGKQLEELQSAAPMAATAKPRISGAAAGQAIAGMPPITPLTAPTERPDEPFTAGMPFGDGPGPRQYGAATEAAPLSATLAKLIQYDPTGELNELYDYVTSRGL